jgi:transcriptional regulator with XRE-family HTH domain
VKRKTKKKKPPRSKPRGLSPQRIADGLEIRRIRLENGWSQRNLASRLKVHQPLISAWEKGNVPSPRMYARLISLPLLYKEQLWAARKAGWDPQTVEALAHAYLKTRGAPVPQSDVVRIPPMPEVEPEGPDLLISKEEVPDTPLVFYVRLRDETDLMRPLFSSGDILIIDTSEKDLREIEDGELVATTSVRYEFPVPVKGAVESGGQRKLIVLAGWLKKYDTPFGNFADMKEFQGAEWESRPDVKSCMLQLAGSQKAMYIGVSGPEPDAPGLLGRIVAWIKAPRAMRGGGAKK